MNFAANTTSTKNLFVYDHINRTIVGKEHHFKQAGIPGSPAYNALMAVMAGQPTYTLAPIASQKKPTKKQTYKGLNMELMAFHIDQHANAEVKAEFTHMVETKVAYPTIKSWFLELYPHIEIAKTQRAMEKKDLADRKASIRTAVKVKMVKATPSVVEMPTAMNF